MSISGRCLAVPDRKNPKKELFTNPTIQDNLFKAPPRKPLTRLDTNSPDHSPDPVLKRFKAAAKFCINLERQKSCTSVNEYPKRTDQLDLLSMSQNKFSSDTDLTSIPSIYNKFDYSKVSSPTPNISFVASTPVTRSLQFDNTYDVMNKSNLPNLTSTSNLNFSFANFNKKPTTQDPVWVDRQVFAFTQWINYILVPPDSTYYTEINSNVSPSINKTSVTINRTDFSFKSPPHNPSSKMSCSLTQKRYLDRLRRKMLELYTSEEFEEMTSQLINEIDVGKLKIRPDHQPWKDVGLKEDLCRLILAYHTLWLRLGLETIFNTNIQVHNEMDIRSLYKFINSHLIHNQNIATKYAHKSVPGIYKKGYDNSIAKLILTKYFTLVLLLDRAKINKLIEHDPYLFTKQSKVKNSTEMLLAFSRNFLYVS